MLVAAALALAAPRSAPAQDTATDAQRSATRQRDSSTERRNGWIVGPLVGLPGAGPEAAYPLVTLGVGVTRLAPNAPGLDFSIGTAAYALAFGVIPVAARLGPSIPLALGRDAFFIPSAGLSAVALAGEEAAPPAFGWYWGAAAVVARGSVGLRAGVTLHRSFVDSDSQLWLAEIGVMHVPLPRLTH